MDRANSGEQDASWSAISRQLPARGRGDRFEDSGRTMGLIRYSTGASLAALRLAGAAWAQTASTPQTAGSAAATLTPAAEEAPTQARPQAEFQMADGIVATVNDRIITGF